MELQDRMRVGNLRDRRRLRRSMPEKEKIPRPIKGKDTKTLNGLCLHRAGREYSFTREETPRTNRRRDFGNSEWVSSHR